MFKGAKIEIEALISFKHVFKHMNKRGDSAVIQIKIYNYGSNTNQTDSFGL